MVLNRNRFLQSIDVFSKTVEDSRIKTTSGGTITLFCVMVVLILIRNEYLDYIKPIIVPQIVVDKDVNKKMDINIDISFPNLPCDIITADLLDELGNSNIDVLQSGFKKYRIIKDNEKHTFKEVKDTDSVMLNNDISFEKLTQGLKNGESGECLSCYGALPQRNNEYCCNTCHSVKIAYARALWGFYDGSGISQCEKEGYIEKLNKRINDNEGCRVSGTTKINRISGSIDFAPGASFTHRGRHIHDLSLYEKHTKKFNFVHKINHLSFGKSTETSYVNPLDNYQYQNNNKFQTISYYIKVVPNRSEFISSKPIESNMFSVTKHDRPLSGGKDKDHQNTIHSRGGLPGVFFYFDISPLKIINKEKYLKTWSSFIISSISSITGVLMFGTIIDRSVWMAEKVIKSKKNM